MSSDKKRVQFRAPHRLINRTDALAEVLGEDRTNILVTALREYLQEATHDDALTQEIAAAYYDDEITFEQLKTLVGAEEAANLRVVNCHGRGGPWLVSGLTASYPKSFRAFTGRHP